MSLLILRPVNKTGAMGKKKQTTLAERTQGEKKINRFPHWWVFSGQTILSGLCCLQTRRGAHSQPTLDFQISFPNGPLLGIQPVTISPTQLHEMMKVQNCLATTGNSSLVLLHSQVTQYSD